MCWIKSKKKLENISPRCQKQVKDLSLFDSIWIGENNQIFPGWIYDISRKHITVVYGDNLKDYKFRITKPTTVTQITQGDKTLYCNE